MNTSNANLTWSQKNGVSPLPRQLRLDEISNEFRAIIWAAIYRDFNSLQKIYSRQQHGSQHTHPYWRSFIEDYAVKIEHRQVDTLSNHKDDAILWLKERVYKNHYHDVLTFLQAIFEHRLIRQDLKTRIQIAFETARMAYRVIDFQIVPIGTEAEATNIKKAFEDASAIEQKGPASHLKNSASALTSGNWADSVRESISAVESVAKVACPEKDGDTLGPIVTQLVKDGRIKHSGLGKSLKNLYGYTSNEKGVRHALVFDDEANIDEKDAMLLFGACASFVSYLIQISKEKSAG